MKKAKFSEQAFLKITTWSGQCWNAEHYYGRIKAGRNEFTLEYQMTQSEADQLNEKDGDAVYRGRKAGEWTERFWTQKQVEESAVNFFKVKLLPLGYKVLIEGDPICHQPQRVIFSARGYAAFGRAITRLWLEGEAIGTWKNEKQMRKISDNWKSLFAPESDIDIWFNGLTSTIGYGGDRKICLCGEEYVYPEKNYLSDDLVLSEDGLEEWKHKHFGHKDYE